jgi:hypothetical protein
MLMIRRISPIILLFAEFVLGGHWWDPGWSREEFVKAAPPGELERLAKLPKHLIFKVGPPASGKTDSLEVAMKELGIAEEPFFEINVDLLVEANTPYGEHVAKTKAWLKSFLVSQGKDSILQHNLDVLNGARQTTRVLPAAAVALACKEDFQAYYKYRQGIDELVYSMLFKEFLHRPYYRHIVYESTGTKGSYEWIQRLGAMARLHGFHVHVVYPLVPYTELLKRSEARALEIGRLVCPERIRHIRAESRANLHEIVKRLNVRDFPVDSVMVFNNRGKRKEMAKLCHYKKEVWRRQHPPIHHEMHSDL